MRRRTADNTILVGIKILILILSSLSVQLLSQTPAILQDQYKSALRLIGEDAYEPAISILQQIVQQQPQFSKAYRNLAEAYIFADELERGQAFFANLVVRDPQNAYAHYGLARIDFSKREYDAAIAKLEKSIELDPEFVEAYGYPAGLTEVYRAKKDLDSAIKYFENLIDANPQNACAYYGLARAYFRKHKFTEAQKLLSKAIELDPQLTVVYHSMIFIFFRTGKYTKVSEYSRNLLDRASDLDDFEMVMYANMMLGNAGFMQGDYSRSLQFLNEAIASARAFGNKRRESTCLNTIAAIYAMSADFPKALKYFNEVLLLAQKTDSKTIEIQALGNIGNVLKDQGDHKEALMVYEKVVQTAHEHKFKYEESLSLSNMAEIYEKRGDYRRSLEYEHSAYAIATEIGEPGVQGFVLQRMGRLYQYLGQDSLAIKHLFDALKIGTETEDIQIIWEAEAGLGSCYEKQGNAAAAVEHYANAVAIYDSMRNSLDIESLRNNFLEDKYEAYPSIVQLLAQSGNVTDALTYAEKYKAKTVLDIISQRQSVFSEVIADTLRENLRQITSGYETAHAELSKELAQADKDPNRILSLDQQIVGLELKKAALMSEFRTKHRAHYELATPKILQLDKIQRILSDDQAILEYILGPQTMSIFAVTADTVIYNEAAVSRERLRDMLASLSTIFGAQERAVESSPKAMMSAQVADFRVAPAFALYEVLIKPVQPWIQDIAELVIVPDDILFYLPFEMLVYDTVGVETPYDFEHAGFLLEKFDISYASSASQIDPGFRRAAEPGKGVLAFGDPNFSLQMDHPDPEDFLASKDALAADIFRRNALVSLPHSRTEVEAVGKALAGKTHDIFVGKQATEENFKDRAPDYRILHLATHFLTDDKQPLYSKIVLAHNTGAKEDGYLQTYEVLNMNLKADLAVLSACNTGLGKLRKGEGVIGISRAFQFAGVPSLLVSLWSVEDQSTAIIMRSFYEKLRAGFNKRQALRFAKIDYLETSSSSRKDPFYWAPFILLGDWQPVDLPAHSVLNKWLVALAIVLMTVIMMFLVRRRMR